MGVVTRLRTHLRAHAAAASHRWPAKGMDIILVYGADGGQLTIVALAAMLQKEGAKIGVLTAQYVEIAGERAEGSDQADVFGDAFRLQALLSQMRKAQCRYVVIEVPQHIPPHQFTGLQPRMVVMRRCGDSHLTEAHNAARKAAWRRLLSLRPPMVVVNRDDPCFDPAHTAREGTITMTYGTHEKAECKMAEVEMHPKGCAVSLVVDHQTELHLATVVAGKAAIYSLVAAAAAGYMLHLPVKTIEEGIVGLPTQLDTLYYVPAQRPYQIVADASITPDGLAETLETLKHFTKNRLIVVVGATLGQPPEWRPLLGELVARFADRVVVTDGEFTAEESAQAVRAQILEGISTANAEARSEEVEDREAAFEKALGIARRGDTVAVVSVIQRPYRQMGGERLTWSDIKKLEELVS